MKKSVLCLCLCLTLLCAAARGEAGAYDQMEMSAARADWIARFGEPVMEGEYERFDDALCAFYESGRLQAKIRAFAHVRDVAGACAGDLSRAKTLRQGALLQDVRALFGGEGAEIMQMNLADEEDSGVRRVIAWANENNQALEALFELEDDEWRLFAAVQLGGE